MSCHPKQITRSHGIKVGDRVRHQEGTIAGTVLSITACQLFSNGGVPMARVHWDTQCEYPALSPLRMSSRHTISQLTKLEQ